MSHLVKFIITVVMASAATVWAAKNTASCANCDKVAGFLKAHDDDEKKAYENFNDFLATVEISKNKKIAAQEVQSILQATPVFLESDERRELPDYLVAIEDAHPKEFAEALKGLSTEQQEDLKIKMQAARKMLKEGEEP